MQANWSLIVNLLLCISAICVGIGYCLRSFMRSREKGIESKPTRQSRRNRACNLSSVEALNGISSDKSNDKGSFGDDIIAIRKVENLNDSTRMNLNQKKATLSSKVPEDVRPSSKTEVKTRQEDNKQRPARIGQPLMMFLLAKENRRLMGYEVLQTILAIGLRFGEGDLFHLYDETKKSGIAPEAATALCSLAAATQTGSFDLNNMGAFQAKGLCLFMSITGNATVDALRFHALYQTALQLKDGLDVHVLDDQRQPLTEESFKRYAFLLNNQAPCQLYASLAAAVT